MPPVGPLAAEQRWLYVLALTDPSAEVVAVGEPWPGYPTEEETIAAMNEAMDRVRANVAENTIDARPFFDASDETDEHRFLRRWAFLGFRR